MKISVKWNLLYLWLVVGLLVPLEAPPLCAQPPPKVLAIVSHNALPYEEALEGFEQHLAHSPLRPEVEIARIEGDAIKAAEEIERASRKGFALILTLGAIAAAAAAESETSIPVVAGLVLNSDEQRGNQNIHWVFLDIPFEVQFHWLTRILPGVRNIGIMYNPEKTEEKIQSAVSIARKHGLNLYPQKIERPSDIPEALSFLSRRVDALLGIPDQSIYTRQTTQHILLFSLRNRIPFIGLSEAWVRAGAFYSLDRDYRDVGLQSAEKAEKILSQGSDTQHAKSSFPRKFVYILNLKTAGHMRIAIPDEIIQGAHKVYR